MPSPIFISACIDLSSGNEEIIYSRRPEQITAFARTVRQSYHGFKFLLSIGGVPSIFNDNRIIDLIINLVQELCFDGLDLRWLYPDTPEKTSSLANFKAHVHYYPCARGLRVLGPWH
jgi:hypothetical protein